MPGSLFSERWARVKHRLTLGDLLIDIVGKMLVGLGLGALLAPVVRPYALGVIVAGVLLSLLVKAKYWKPWWS